MHNYEDEQKLFFSELLGKHGHDYKTLHWGSPQTQQARFLELLKIFTLTYFKGPTKLLDYGCGLGHLYEFIRDNNFLELWDIDYSGSDINQDLIEEAKKKYPRERFFVNSDALYKEKFDFVFCSGLFNLKFDELFDIAGYYMSELSRLFDIANCGVAVNFQSIDGIELIPKTFKADELKRFYFHDPAVVLKNLKSITKNTQISTGYLKNDFTVYLLK